MEIFKLFGSIMVDSDAADKSISKTGDKAESMGSKLGKGVATAGKWALGIGVAAVGVGVAAFGMTKKVTESFDKIAKGSQRMGVTTDFYQEMDFWASQNGLSHENMEKAVGRLNQRIGMAADGNDKYATALETLGVNMDDVRNGTVSTEEVMAQSIQSLSEMKNGNEQAALASELFGTKLGRELLPALQDGALSMEDAKQKAAELGLVIGEDSIAAGVVFQDTWDQLKRSLGAAGMQISAQMIPAFQAMMDWVMAHMPTIQAVIKTVFDVIGVIFDVFKTSIGAVVETLQGLFTSNEETMNGIWNTIQTVFTSVVEFLKLAWETIRAFWEENGKAILDNAKTVFETIWNTIKTNLNAVKEVFEEIIGYIVPWVKGKLEELQKFWDENGEQIMKAVQNAFSFIQGVIEVVMPIIQAIIKGAWKIIQSVFDAVIGVIMGLVKVFSSLLTGDFEGIKTGLTNIWTSLWDGIKGIVAGAWTLLSGVFESLWTSVSGWFEGLKDDAVTWGKNMIQGFIDGILGMIGKVTEAVGRVISTVGDFLGFGSPTKKGPGRNIVKWGKNMVDGFLQGVDEESTKVGGVVSHLIGNMPSVSGVSRTGVSGYSSQSGQLGSVARSASVINQEINIHSPKHLTPSETARLQKRASQELALEW